VEVKSSNHLSCEEAQKNRYHWVEALFH
jgi:hypothetical protein